MDQDEIDLIDRAKEGNLDAFDELVKRYERRVFNFAYRMAGNYDDAYDVSQNAFIRVFNALHSFRGDSNFSTWLFRIVTNVYLDERKKQRAHQNTSLEEYIELEESTVTRQIEDPNPTPSEAAEANERNEILQEAIYSLPDYQRMMVLLYHSQHKSYDEIAAIMNLPIGTVKSRLNRARLALKEKLQGRKELFFR